MAHEIAHVAARHGTRQATKGELMQIGTLAAMIATGGWAGYAIRQGAGLLIPMGYLTFTRAYEREADFYGLQYMYKAGYDPVAFVDFFEKIETLEKKKPGSIAKVFSTHPMTDDRIKAAQAEIEKTLTPKPEYVVNNNSEFNDVRNRLAMLHGRRKVDNSDPNKPTLRRAPGTGTPADPNPDGTQPKTDEGDRPTLKRRDTTGGN